MRRRTHGVPTNDREIFIDPPINRVPELIHSNRCKFSAYDFTMCGIPFQEFRSMARREVLRKATEYTRQITTPGPDDPPMPPFPEEGFEGAVIQTGYQPTFYHPGIWLKNHLAHHIARRVNGTGVNICTDNDVCGENWIYLPGVDEHGMITQERVEFMAPSADLAFEELPPIDADKIMHFKERALACLSNSSPPGGAETFEKFADLMVEASRRTSNIGEILTASRRRMEGFFGIHNLEAPVSRICEGDGFLIFFLAILLDCMRFADAYNDRLEHYRRARKLRSRAQPFPDLMTGGGTVEVPFWAWRRGGARKRLFVRREGGGEHVRLIFEGRAVLSLDTGSTVTVQEQLARLRGGLVDSGIKVRPRAITTTMFSRLFLSDLFIHGVGGARYDVITDAVIKDFFGVEPPGFLTASATLFLSFQAVDVTKTDLNARRRLLRDMRYNPERHLPAGFEMGEEIRSLISEKQKIIESSREESRREERLDKFKRMREINTLLENRLLPYLQQERRELRRMEGLVRQNKVMRSRTYPFVIYPEALLKDFFGRLSGG